MKTYFTVASLTAYASAIGISKAEERFTHWANKHSKNYTNANERAERMKTWMEKDNEYRAINANPDNTFTVGHNKYSDWAESEWRQLLLPPIVVIDKDGGDPDGIDGGSPSKGGGGTTTSCPCSSSCGP